MFRPQPDNTQHSQETDVHASGGIRISQSPQASDRRPTPRPSGQWDRSVNPVIGDQVSIIDKNKVMCCVERKQILL